MEIQGKTAVVTGGASGIGRGIAHALAEKKAAVIVADLDEKRAVVVAGELEATGVRALGVACDVADEAQVEALADRAWREFGRVDLLFNNAGAAGGAALLDSRAEDLAWLFSVNVFGLWYGCKAFGRRFRDQDTPAWIVNTGSEHSFGVAHLFAGFYTASKHAVLGLSDVLRRELPDHVGVSVLCPGLVDTEFWKAAERRPGQYGGPSDPQAITRAIMARGTNPLDVGRRAVAGVEREDFYIVTHAHARTFAEERYREIMAAFESQAPAQPGDERYDVGTIIRDLLSKNTGV
ncbi:MAG: SDR family NAD(P)-dependent oxidoreductase [Deltaproteobacteria bacterium]|nr:SDR family NAD(P)-dependent oxidoreductase [Deltaproteobacteria bacterium]